MTILLRRPFAGWFILMAAVLLVVIFTPASLLAQNTLSDILADELDREMRQLSAQEIPPYFIGYTVSDVHAISISASFGALTGSVESDSRLLTVEIRVGDYQQDNTHELRDQYDYSSSGYVLVARDDNEDAIRTAIWQETNRQYREAVERFIKVKTNVAIKVAEEDSSADFSHEPELVTYIEPPVKIASFVKDKIIWEEKVKKFSAPFLADENIYGGQASFSFTFTRKYLVTSEGTRTRNWKLTSKIKFKF